MLKIVNQSPGIGGHGVGFSYLRKRLCGRWSEVVFSRDSEEGWEEQRL